MTGTVRVHNTHKNMKKECFSADGNSVSIMPDTKVDLEEQFLWNMPREVVRVQDTHTVFGKKSTTVVVETETENDANANDARETVKVIEDVPPAVGKKK